MKRVLVLSPHADDSELGMGGTIAKHSAKGDDVYVVCVATHKNNQVRKLQMIRAVNEMNASVIFIEGFEDGLVGSDMRNLVKALDAVKNFYKPEVMYLPFPSVHQDHVAVYEAGLRMARISLNSSQWYIPTVLVYREPVSQIDIYNTGLSFSIFNDISGDFIKAKMRAIACHKSEIQKYPHPSSPQYLDYEARAEGGKYGVEHAEVFAAVRKEL